MNSVGKNIKRYRNERKMTQDQLAEKMNVTRQAVSNWENSKTQPDIDTITLLAEVLGVSVEEIIYGTRKENNKVNNIVINAGDGAKKGIGFGACLAMVISYAKWHSIGWAILHGLMNWIYVIYYIINYGWNG